MSRNIKTSIHSPGQFRVLGTFKNLKEFSKDFNCPVGKIRIRFIDANQWLINKAYGKKREILNIWTYKFEIMLLA